MINLDLQPDISWLIGMETQGDDGSPGIISQAKQQTKFAMDEFGAKVESAAALGVMRCTSLPEYHIINRPFLAVVHRPGLSQPIFAGYLAEDCWNRPARTNG